MTPIIEQDQVLFYIQAGGKTVSPTVRESDFEQTGQESRNGEANATIGLRW
jgi:hypothetical protein